MNIRDCLLEEYKLHFIDNYRYVIKLLDEDKKWEKVVSKLRNYRIAIFLQERLLTKMAHSSSPSQILLDELISRSCKTGQLIDLLEECKLLDVLSVLINSDRLEIIVQPGENDQLVHINDGDELKLECYATGHPPLSYQWYCLNTPLKNCTQPSLIITNFREANEGDYYCIVSHIIDNKQYEITSNTVICQLMESAPQFLNELPENKTVYTGSEVVLAVQLLNTSHCKLEWIKGNTILNGANTNILKISNASKLDEGEYRCIATNSAGEVYSKPCKLTVNPIQTKASAKVALLIANFKYKYHSELHKPCNDVIEIAKILKKLNFHVITLMNLTLVEMHNAVQLFCELLPSKSYGFFYYGGHGYEIFNNKFMMPVDCPDSSTFRMADCFCDLHLIQMAMKNTKLRLLVIILDMCLKIPDRAENPNIYQERTPDFNYTPNPKCNLVQANATSSYLCAYENPGEEYGLYVNSLRKYLSSDVPITECLQHVNEEFCQHNFFGKQKPSLSSDGCNKYKLTDPVQGSFSLDKRMAKVSTIADVVELKFKQLKLVLQLQVTPHRGCILNAIDFIFPQEAKRWRITADVPEVLNEYSWNINKDDSLVLTLYNIQKVKSDIYITIKLCNEDRGAVKLVDFSHIDLGIPLIAPAKLWFDVRT